MSGLIFSSKSIVDHLSHIVSGLSIREIARKRDCDPSTVLRRIQKIEELRDHPEIDAIIDAFEKRYSVSSAMLEPDRESLALVLGVDLFIIYNEVADFFKRLGRGGQVIAGAERMAAISFPNKPTTKVRYRTVLAALAFGWISPVGDYSGKVRKFKATGRISECLSPPRRSETQSSVQSGSYKYSTRPNAIESSFVRGDGNYFTSDHLRLSREFFETYYFKETTTAERYADIQLAMPSGSLNLLERVCVKGEGFQSVEASLGYPARSAKALTAQALEFYSHVMAQV